VTAQEAAKLAKKSRDKVQNQDFSGVVFEQIRFAAANGNTEVRVPEERMTGRTRQILEDAGFRMYRVNVYSEFDKRYEFRHSTWLERRLPVGQEWLVSW